MISTINAQSACNCCFLVAHPWQQPAVSALQAAALTIPRHPHREAFLQAAVLAAVAAGPVDQTVLLPRTRVRGIALLTPPEKALPCHGKTQVKELLTDGANKD